MDARLKFTDEQAETSFSDTVSGDSVLTIPLFQRPYRWTKQNLDWFWQDVSEIREGATQSEFMGVVVAVQRGVRAGRPIPFEIVDGQQRLSTIYLFVTAAVEVIARTGESTAAANLLGTYLVVRRMASNPINTKLIPSYADRAQFKIIWDRIMSIPGFATHPEIEANPPKPPAATGPDTGRMLQQYGRLRSLIAKELPDIGLEATLDLVELVVGRLSVVNITLKDPTVAPKIFERLNARAEPITIADLVRNEVFSRIDDEPDEAHRIFEQDWEPFAESFAAPRNNDLLEKFLFPYGLILNPSVSKRDLFVQLREHWASLQGPSEIIEDMRRFSPIFMALETGSAIGEVSPALQASVYKIHRLNKPSSTYAFIMKMISAVKVGDVDESDAIAVLACIESFLFRRAICGIEPTGLHAVFKGMWRELVGTDTHEDFSNVTADRVRSYIISKPTISWPGDREFEEALRRGKLYHRKVAKYALAELEIQSQGETPQDDFHIEHVLPQTPTEEWLEIFGANWEDVVHTWANLLPLTESMNPQVSRAAYGRKRQAFEGSIFSTTRNFSEEVHDWTPSALNGRADQIVTFALARWP